MLSKQIHSERLDIQYTVHKFSPKHLKLMKFYYSYLLQNVTDDAPYSYKQEFGTQSISNIENKITSIVSAVW